MIDFQTRGEEIVTILEMLGHIMLIVVLVLNVSEDLLDNILEGHNATCTAKLIDHHTQRPVLLQEYTHELLCRHRLGHERHRADMILPAVRIAEHLRAVDISFYMINVTFIDNNL